MGSNYIITSDGSFVNADELYHHGILGMKWGIRRYQNPDGSLTAKGRKRYTNSDGSLNEKGKKFYAKESERLRSERKKLVAQKHTAEKLSKLDARRKANEDLKNQLGLKKEDKKKGTKDETPKKKSISDMTDEELSAAIARARMEDTYRQLRLEPVNEKSKLMKKMLNEVIVPGAVDAGKKALSKMVEKAMKDTVDPNSYEALKKEYDKLSIKQKLEKIKRGEDPDAKPMSWDDKIKQQQYMANERKYAQEAAQEEARKAKESAEREAKERRDTTAKQQKNRRIWERLNSNSNSNQDFNNRTKSQQSEYDFTYKPKSTAETVRDRMNSRSKSDQDFVRNNAKKQKQYDFDWDVKKGKVEGTGTSRKKSSDNGKSSSKSSVIYDSDNVYKGSDGYYHYRDTPVTSLATTRNTSSGNNWVSRYSNMPISGLLPDPKDRDR